MTDLTTLIAELRRLGDNWHPNSTSYGVVMRAADAIERLRETLTAVEVVNDAQRKAERRLAKRQLAEALAAERAVHDDDVERLFTAISTLTAERDDIRADYKRCANALDDTLAAKDRAEVERDQWKQRLDETLGRYYWPHVAVTKAEAERDEATAKLERFTEHFDRAVRLAANLRVRRLTAALANAREALEPFAKEADRYEPDEGDGNDPIWDSTHRLQVKNLRNARYTVRALSIPATEPEDHPTWQGAYRHPFCPLCNGTGLNAATEPAKAEDTNVAQ